jgi:2-dehydropantoate 2-reductase
MKVCVFGVGAVGSYLVARLANVGGITLAAVARGDTLRMLQTGGVRVEAPEAYYEGRPAIATDRPESLPGQDIVFVALKSITVPGVARALKQLLGANGHAVFATNGIPWWWNHGYSQAGALPLLDPDGELWNGLTPQKALGCVVHSGNEVITPGVIRNNGNNFWPIGEPDNKDSPRLRRTVGLLQSAGIGAQASADIRKDIFAKLLRNAAFNSICALTGLPLEWLSQEPSVKALTLAVMDEIVAIAAAHGFDIREEARSTRELKSPPPGLMPVRGQKPSMLQDALARRPMEVDAIVGQTCAFAAQAGVSCPALQTMLLLLRGLNARGVLGL